MRYLIDMPEGWDKPLCEICPHFVEGCYKKQREKCPLANAKKAVEVKSIAGYDLSAVSGGKLWATEEE